MADMNKVATAPISPISPISFADFLHTGGELTKTAGGYYAQYTANTQSYVQLFTLDDVSTVDERLPLVIDALLTSKYGQHTEGRVYTKALLLTLHHWSNPSPIFSTGKKQHHVLRVTGVSVVPHSANVKLWANAYTNVALTNSVPYVTNSRMMAFEVSKRELERHYPGWQTRYQVMQDLQTDSIETLQLVFARPVKDVEQANTFDMSAISFD